MDGKRTLEFNARNIAEFRSSGGKLGGPFEGAPVLLLTTIGDPGFAKYRERTGRIIPVIELTTSEA